MNASTDIAEFLFQHGITFSIAPATDQSRSITGGTLYGAEFANPLGFVLRTPFSQSLNASRNDDVTTMAEVFDALLSDAILYRDALDVDEFAVAYCEGMTFSATLKAWNDCQQVDADLALLLGTEAYEFARYELDRL